MVVSNLLKESMRDFAVSGSAGRSRRQAVLPRNDSLCEPDTVASGPGNMMKRQPITYPYLSI